MAAKADVPFRLAVCPRFGKAKGLAIYDDVFVTDEKGGVAIDYMAVPEE